MSARPTPSRCCGSTPRPATQPTMLDGCATTCSPSSANDVRSELRHEPRPGAARDHRLPGLPRRARRGRGRPASWCAPPAAWPTRSATTSRCCWSTRPAARSRARSMAGAVRRLPARRRGRARRAPTTCCARSPRPAPGSAGRPARRPRRSPGGRRLPGRATAARRGRRRPGLPAAARGPRAVVPGAVRGLARAVAARLGRRLDLVVVLAPRGQRHRSRVGASPRRSAAAASWSSPARRARWSPSTPPAATHGAADARPATSSPPPW